MNSSDDNSEWSVFRMWVVDAVEQVWLSIIHIVDPLHVNSWTLKSAPSLPLVLHQEGRFAASFPALRLDFGLCQECLQLFLEVLFWASAQPPITGELSKQDEIRDAFWTHGLHSGSYVDGWQPQWSTYSVLKYNLQYLLDFQNISLKISALLTFIYSQAVINLNAKVVTTFKSENGFIG